MRPIALEFTAFGSYGGTTWIDFERLGRHGVFAITGPTGAGKTTIFDAMTYALFGELSSGRTIGDFRSDHADPAVSTTVTFTFEVRGERWVVTRTPTQDRARQRGDGGVVSVPGKVTLQRAGSPAGGLSRTNEVKEKVAELVGLSASQFNQVILLPQGAFEEVLRSDTNKRADLLRQLFPVDRYQRVTERLKEEAASRKRALESVQDQSAGVVESARAELVEAGELLAPHVEVAWPDGALDEDRFDIRQLEELLVVLDGGRKALGELVAGASEQAAAAREAVKAHDAAVAAFDRWTVNVAARQDFPGQELADAAARVGLDRARTLLGLAASLETLAEARRDLAALEPDHATRRAGMADLWPDHLDPEALEDAVRCGGLAVTVGADADQLDSALRDIGELDALTSRAADQDERVGTRAEQLELDAVELDVRVEEELDCRTRIAALVQQIAGADAAAARVTVLTAELARSETRDRAVTEVASIELQIAAAIEQVDRAREARKEIRTAWRSGLASRLAADLVDGDPCPTCGAIDHPHPASAGADVIDDAGVEAAEAALETASRAKADLEAGLAAQQVLATALERETAAVREDLMVAQAAASELEHAKHQVLGVQQRQGVLTEWITDERSRQSTEQVALATARAGAEATRREVEQLTARLVDRYGSIDLDPELPARRRQLADLLAAHASSLTETSALEARVATSSEALAPTVAAWGLDGPEELAAYQRTELEIEAGQAALTVRSEERRRVEEEISTYEREGGPTERPRAEGLAEAAAAAESRRDTLVGVGALVDAKVDLLEQVPDRLAGVGVALTAATADFEEANELAVLCAGAAGGGGARISLEHWVLAEYLRDVLAQANVRLLALTGGRYWLEVARAGGDRRASTGLDLSVFDGDTGAARSANTLSGGESFLASVALALGLADVVSAGANHEVGALFIDEGFGTLDVDFLDATIDVLASLQDGGRMVGVISHVEGLKAAIPTGIEVVRSPSGSTVRAHYPGE